MAQTSPQQQTALQWLKFLQDLAQVQQQECIDLEQYAWHLDLEAYPEVLKTAIANCASGSPLLFKVDKPRDSVCPMPDESFAEWLESDWQSLSVDSPSCFACRLLVKLPVAYDYQVAAVGCLTQAEWQVLSGQSSCLRQEAVAADLSHKEESLGGSLKVSSTLHFQDNFIANQDTLLSNSESNSSSARNSTTDPSSIHTIECVRFTSNQEWIETIKQGNTLIKSCQLWSEQESLIKAFNSWQIKRQAWLQVRRSEDALTKLYHKLKQAYSMLQFSSGEAELILGDGLLRIPALAQWLSASGAGADDLVQGAPNTKQSLEQSGDAYEQSTALDQSKAQAANVELSSEQVFNVDQSGSQSANGEAHVLESTDATKSLESSSFATASITAHPLVLRAVKLEFNARLEQFVLSIAAEASQLHTPLLQALDEQYAWSQLQAQVSLIHPLDKAQLKSLLMQLGSRLPHCLVTSQRTYEASLIQNYTCLLSAGPCLFIRAYTPDLSSYLANLITYVEHGGLLSAPAYQLLAMQPQFVRTEDDSARYPDVQDSALEQSSQVLPNSEDQARLPASLHANTRLKNLSCESLEMVMSQPLNPQQHLAVKRLNRQPVVLVHSPSGTGKSYTAANLISQALAQGQKILVTAMRQDTVDQVIAQLPKALHQYCGTSSHATCAPELLLTYRQADLHKLESELAIAQQQRTQVFNELLEQRTQLFNWLSFDNLHIVYQQQEYTCAQLDDFVKEHAALAEVIPFTPKLEGINTEVEDRSKSVELDESRGATSRGGERVQGVKSEGMDDAQVVNSTGDNVHDENSSDINTVTGGDRTNKDVASLKSTPSESELMGRVLLQDLPLSMDELQRLYATNDSVPSSMEDSLKLSWPPMRALPNPSQFLELLQNLSKLQQSLDHAQNWQVDLNLAQGMVWFRPDNGAASALFGEKIQLLFSVFKPALANTLNFGLLNEFPEWLGEIYKLEPKSAAYTKFSMLAHNLIALHGALNAYTAKLGTRQLELNPQLSGNSGALKQLQQALQIIKRHIAAHSISVNSANTNASNTATAVNSADTADTVNTADTNTEDLSNNSAVGALPDPEKVKQAYAALERALRINKQPVHGAEDISCALDFVQYQQLKLKCALQWQELMPAISHIKFEELENDRTAVRWGYLFHWLLTWSHDRASLLKLWQERFDALGWTARLNLQLQDTGSNTLQRALSVWSALQRAGQEAVYLSQLVVRYYNFCQRYSQVLKLLSQPQFKENPCCCLLLQAMTRRDPPLYAKAFKQLQQVAECVNDYAERKELLERLAQFAPDWSTAIAERQGIHGRAQVPEKIAESWQYWQFAQCLSQITSRSQNRLTQQFAPLKSQFYESSLSCIEKQAKLNLVKALQQQYASAYHVTEQVSPTKLLPAWVLPIFKLSVHPEILQTHFDVLVIEQPQSPNLLAAAVPLFNLSDHVLFLQDDISMASYSWYCKAHHMAEVLMQKTAEKFGLATRLQQLMSNVSLEGLAESNDSSAISTHSSDFILGWAMGELLGQFSGFIAGLLSAVGNGEAVWQEQPTSKALWKEQFTQMPQLMNLSNLLIGNQTHLHALCVPRYTSLTPCGLFVQAGRYALSTAVALLQACCEQNEYNGRSMGIMFLSPDRQTIKLWSEQLSLMLNELMPLSVQSQHQVRFGPPQVFGGESCDVLFVVMDMQLTPAAEQYIFSGAAVEDERVSSLASAEDCSTLDVHKDMHNAEQLATQFAKMCRSAVAIAKEQLWLICANEKPELPQDSVGWQLIEYVIGLHKRFIEQKPSYQQAASDLIQVLEQDAGIEPLKRRFMQQLVQSLCERGFQLQVMPSSQVGEPLRAAHTQGAAYAQNDAPLDSNILGSADDPAGLVVLYQQKRLRLECHSESELSHASSVLSIMQRHERYEHYGYSVLHVLCSSWLDSTLEQLIHQLQREGFYPENLRGFLQVLMHQASLALVHKVQDRANQLMRQSTQEHAETQSSNGRKYLQLNLVTAPNASMLSAISEHDGLSSNASANANTDGNQQPPVADKQDQSLQSETAESRQSPSSSEPSVSTQDAQNDKYSPLENQAHATDFEQSRRSSSEYEFYRAADPKENQLLSMELEKVMTRCEQERAELTSTNGSGKVVTDKKVEAETDAKYNYALARLGIKTIEQPLPDPLPDESHARFRAFKRFFFGMLKQMRMSYIDLLSSYQIVAVTPSMGQTQQFLRLCEALHLRPNIYTPSKPMNKRVWCIRQSDLMSPYALQAAQALCKGAAESGAIGERTADNASAYGNDAHEQELGWRENEYENQAARLAQQRELNAQQAYAARKFMSEEDENSPLISALNRALNPYWGELADDETMRSLPQTMQAVRRRQIAQNWEPPRSTNQFLREQILPPPMRRNLNREDVNTLAVLSMIPKQNAMPNPSKARLHTLRVTNGKSSGTNASQNSRSNQDYQDASKSQTASGKAIRGGRYGSAQYSSQAKRQAANLGADGATERTSLHVAAETSGLVQDELIQATGSSASSASSASSRTKEQDNQSLGMAQGGSLYQERRAETQQGRDDTDADELGRTTQSYSGFRTSGISDSHLKEAAKQIENANLAEGEFSLSSIFNIPEVSSAVSASMAQASSMLSDHSEPTAHHSQVEKSAYPTYGAGASANSRIKRAGAVDYPGMPQLKDTLRDDNLRENNLGSTNLRDSHGREGSLGNSSLRDGSTLSNGTLREESRSGKLSVTAPAPQASLAAHSVSRQGFNADAAVAELLMQYDQDAALEVEGQQLSSDAASSALSALSNIGIQSTAPAHNNVSFASSTASMSSAPADVDKDDRVTVTGSIMGIGEIKGDIPQQSTAHMRRIGSDRVQGLSQAAYGTGRSYMQSTAMGNLYHAASHAAQTAVGSPAHTAMVNASYAARGGGKGSTAAFNNSSLHNAADTMHHAYSTAGSMHTAVGNTSVTGRTGASSMATHRGGGYSITGKAGWNGRVGQTDNGLGRTVSSVGAIRAAGTVNSGGAVSSAGSGGYASGTTGSTLSAEQTSYLAMLLQRSEIWFKQEGATLQAKVLPSQEDAFKDICKAMGLKPRLIASGQGSAYYQEWRF